MNTIEHEAHLFTKYLIQREPNPHAIRLYMEAMASSRPGTVDRKLLNFMVKHPKSIGFIDSGLVFVDPYSEARKHLYVMLAILEANAKYSDLFLPKKRSPYYVLFVFYSGVRAVIKAGLGILLIKVIA